MLGLHWLVPLKLILTPFWNFLGLIPLVIGVLINVAASNTFQRVKTTIKPFEESSTLVTGGLYQVSRNPMYLGLMLVLTGVATLLGSLTSYLVIPVFMILIERNFIRMEEHKLEQKFGQSWQKYQQQIRRWV